MSKNRALWRVFLGDKLITCEDVRRVLGLEVKEVERNTCQACGEQIRVMVFRGTGYCSGGCEKRHKVSVTMVPHNASRSFDWATCVCGWSESDDDTALLQGLVDDHNRILAHELVPVEAFTP